MNSRRMSTQIIRTILANLLVAGFILNALQSTPAQSSPAGQAKKPPLVRVSITGIRDAAVIKSITDAVKASPYAVKHIVNGAEWNLNFTENDKDADSVLIHRDLGVTAGTLKKSEMSSERVSALIKREYLWQSLQKLENSSGHSNIGVEIRPRLIKGFAPRENGFCSGELTDESSIGQFGLENAFIIEYRNTGNVSGYISILNLSPDGTIALLLPSYGNELLAPPDKKWSRTGWDGGILGRCGVFYLPEDSMSGNETIKVLITPAPLDPNTIAALGGGGSGRGVDVAATIYKGDFIGGDNWGTASLHYLGAPPPTLYSISVELGVKDKKEPGALDSLKAASAYKHVSLNLSGSQIKQAEVQAAFENVIKNASEQDTFIFYFNGVVDDETSDAEGQTNFRFRLNDSKQKSDQGSVPFSLMQAWLGKIRAKNRLIMLDRQFEAADFTAITSQFIDLRRKKTDKATGVWANIAVTQQAGMERLIAKSLDDSFAAESDLNGDGSISVFEIESFLSRKSLQASSGKVRFNNSFQGDDFVIGRAKPKSEAGKADPKPIDVPQRAEVFAVTKSDSAPAKKLGKSYALIFATNTYEHYADLKNPINDAEDLGKALTDEFGFEVDIRRNLKLDEIYAAFEEYQARKFEPNDQLLIFFAGHGTYKPAPVDLGYIIAADSKKVGIPERIFFSFAAMAQQINRIGNNHILLVLDVCHGGSFGIKTRSPDDGGEYGEISPVQRISRTIEHKARRYITSGGNEYVSDGKGRNSPFAYRFLATLRDPGPERRDGLITYFELFDRLSTTPNQTPHAGDFDGNMPGSNFYFQVIKPK